MGPSIHVQGTRKTDPMETLTALRLSGSQDVGVSNTASIPSAAAERKMAPIFVVSTTPSTTTILWAWRHTSSTGSADFRRMAQSTPRVSVYPVSEANN